MTEVDKAGLLQEFRVEVRALRSAAAALSAVDTGADDWGPREVLAHITLWAVQAREQFRLRLSPLDYGSSQTWKAGMAATFEAAFEYLSDRSPQSARRTGWAAVAKSGVVLPPAMEETPDEHLRVDEAFNAAAVELVSGRAFEDVLRLAERSQENLLQILEQAPADEYEHDRDLYRRLLLIVRHHVEHRLELERQLAGATG